VKFEYFTFDGKPRVRKLGLLPTKLLTQYAYIKAGGQGCPPYTLSFGPELFAPDA
jgi:hypothetical protein